MNEVFRALADPTRRRILELLQAKDMSAGEIAEHFDITKPSLSKHFNILKDADLIRGIRHGTSIVYQLNVSLVEEALLGLLSKLNSKKGK